MGIIALEKASGLYWLGRYNERVYTTLREFFVGYDRMIDESEDSYKELCNMLDIPDVYGSKMEFINNYPFDESNVDSIISNLTRAYDNAMVMRDVIGTETISYVEMALSCIKKARCSDAPLLELQEVIDYILAFWGYVDDSIDDRGIRSIIKAGRRVERLDLYLRFERPVLMLEREFAKLQSRIKLTGLPYDQKVIDYLERAISENKINYSEAVLKLENILKL